MKLFVKVLLLNLLMFNGLYAQEERVEEEILIIAEEDPEFPGGNEALFKWINENLVYPEEALAEEIQGKVYVQFVVEPDGSLSNIKIMRSPHELLSKEVKRLMRAMPKWKPGKQSGKAVRTRFTLPVIFRMY